MKIGDYTLKKITHFRDHEGMYISQGDVYKGKKKIAYFSEDSWGGPMQIDYNDNTDREELVSFAKDWMEKNPYGIRKPEHQSYIKEHDFTMPVLFKNSEDEGLIVEMLALLTMEKEAKKMFKKGYRYYVCAIDNRGMEYSWGIGSMDAINILKEREFKVRNIIEHVIYGEKDFEVA